MDVHTPRADEAIRATLLSELDRLTDQLQAMDDEAQKIREAAGTRPGFGKRVGDYTTEVLEAANNRAVARNINSSITDVKRALAKFDAGTYGLCDSCGLAINPERLEALPAAVECIDCKRKRERRR